jgi:hypothetical protein
MGRALPYKRKRAVNMTGAFWFVEAVIPYYHLILWKLYTLAACYLRLLGLFWCELLSEFTRYIRSFKCYYFPVLCQRRKVGLSAADKPIRGIETKS